MEEIAGNWELGIAALVSACAFIAAFLSAPDERAGTLYKAAYKIINYIGCNFGKAVNADDSKRR